MLRAGNPVFRLQAVRKLFFLSRFFRTALGPTHLLIFFCSIYLLNNNTSCMPTQFRILGLVANTLSGVLSLGRVVKLTTNLHLASWLRMSRTRVLNQDLVDVYREADIISESRKGRVGWLAHVKRMPE